MIRLSRLSLLITITVCILANRSESKCPRTCDLALASYNISLNYNLSYIGSLFGMTDVELLYYNPSITNKDSVLSGFPINVNFSCDCMNDSYLGHQFPYTVLQGDTYYTISRDTYANLTTSDWLASTNPYPVINVPNGATINVIINCSCGDPKISKEYGLFITYPLQPGDNLSSVAAEFNLTAQQELLTVYNPGVNFSAGSGLVFIPTHDRNGNYYPFNSKSISGGALAGIVIAAAIVLILLGIFLYFWINKRYKAKKALLLPSASEEGSIPLGNTTAVASMDKAAIPLSPVGGITVDKSVEFSYEELSRATDEFSLSNKIGQGGYGSVYYAELRGEKAAIKKMEMQASQEFLAELKVLTHVHHLNLVRLIGYCIEGSLFLVYEYIENGNLSQHLRGSGRAPLPWANRVQIALDSARGLEYIHEHTVPVYIHRDIKSANILIDKNFRAKVADFGLTKLTEVGSMSLPTRVVGTFGYMPPEYARYGDVSPKVDVYAFGVVLYELISAKEAIIKSSDSSETKGLIGLFDDALSKPDPKESLRKLIDPRLGDDYPIDSVYKMVQLAKQCTQDEPQNRPSMRSVVVALMTLSSGSEFWDMASFFDNQGLVNLMSGR